MRSLPLVCLICFTDKVWCSKYNFKTKKMKLDPHSELSLEEARAVSALLQSQPEGGSSDVAQGPLEEQLVATISAEIAAALAKAQARIYEDDDYEEDEESGSELGQTDGIAPNTSRIRDEDGHGPPSGGGGGGGGGGEERAPVGADLGALLGGDEEEEFPIPLRTRKGKEPVGVIGLKRKR